MLGNKSYDMEETVDTLANTFISVGIEAGIMYQKVLQQAKFVGKDHYKSEIQKLGVDAMDRAWGCFLMKKTLEDLSLQDQLLYGIIHVESERRGMFFNRGRNLGNKDFHSTKLNTHKAFGLARPARINKEGKWEAFWKIDADKNREWFYRGLAHFEEENIGQHFSKMYEVTPQTVEDPPEFKLTEAEIETIKSEMFIIVTDRKRDEEFKHSHRKVVSDAMEELKVSIAGGSKNRRIACIGKPFPGFQGRIEELAQLRKAFTKKGAAFIVVITGLSGIGKTQLAITFASEIYNAVPESSCLLLDVKSEETLAESLASICARMNITQTSECEVNVFSKILEKLQSLEHTVVILDNMDSESEPGEKLLKEYIKKQGGNPLFVVTSTEKHMLRMLHPYLLPSIRLEELRLEEAEALVKKELKDFLTSDDNENVKSLCEKLQNYPPALRQAAAFIRDECSKNSFHKYTIKEYVKDFDTKISETLHYDFDGIYERTTFAAMTQTIDKLEESVQVVLRLVLFAGENLFSFESLVQLYSYLKPEGEEKKLEESATVLEKYTLIDIEGRLIRIHKVVQEVTRIRFKQQLLEEAGTILNSSAFDKCNRHRLATFFDGEILRSTDSSIKLPKDVVQETIRVCRAMEIVDQEGVTALIEKHWLSFLSGTMLERSSGNRIYILCHLKKYTFNHPIIAMAVVESIAGSGLCSDMREFCNTLWEQAYSDGKWEMSLLPDIPGDYSTDFWQKQFLKTLSDFCRSIFREARRADHPREALGWWEKYELVEPEANRLGLNLSYTLTRYEVVCLHCQSGNYEKAFEIAAEKGEVIKYYRIYDACYALYIARGLLESNNVERKAALFPALDFSQVLLHSLEHCFQFWSITKVYKDPFIRAARNCKNVFGTIVPVDVGFVKRVRHWRYLRRDIFFEQVDIDGEMVTLDTVINDILKVTSTKFDPDPKCLTI